MSQEIHLSVSVAHIAVKKAAGYNLISVDEFFAIALAERVRMIKAREIQFLDDEGNQMLTSSALKYLTEVYSGQK